MLPRIIYDSTCPICRNYMKLVQRKIDKLETEAKTKLVEFFDTDSAKNDFEYVDASGTSHLGTKAIDVMAKDFPAIKDYMWMLPAEFQVSGLKVAYKVGSVVRKAYGAVRKGCNCGKKK